MDIPVTQMNQNTKGGNEALETEHMLSVVMPADRPLRIAQFTDLHFGRVGGSYHNNRPERTKDYMKYFVDTQKPDLIVCTGDNIMSTGVEKLKEFVDILESYKTPWTFVFGNHDAEPSEEGYNKKSLSNYLASCDAQYLLYEDGYVEATENRYGNYSISVLNSDKTKLLGVVICIDTGTYDHEINSYESITEGQIDWYKREVDRLNALYTGEGTVPSVVFTHIPLPEFYPAYNDALTGDGSDVVIPQALTPFEIEGIRIDGPTDKNTGFFSVMKEKESTVAFLCGHSHTLDFQVKIDGIVLGFGPQTGFSPLFPNNDMPRKSYMYCLEENFEFTTVACMEEGKGLGLAFTGTFDADAEYDANSGTYVVSYNFNFENNIEFSYDGVRITTENTQITGAFHESTSPTWKGGFYSPNGRTLIYDGTIANTCTFIYDPEKKTLHIEQHEVETDPNAPTSVSFATVDEDAGADAIGLWTKTGTKLKWVTDPSTGAGEWIGNHWRYFVVVDKEGRVAYAVLWPLCGYGEPVENTYYTHPCYKDYRTNPAIRLLDGYADDYPMGGFCHSLYEIVVPDGGFAFTGHGAAIFPMIDMLSQGTVADYGVMNINTRSLFHDKIRVSYDLEKKTVSIS